jgi:hypothetical protein
MLSDTGESTGAPDTDYQYDFYVHNDHSSTTDDYDDACCPATGLSFNACSPPGYCTSSNCRPASFAGSFE